MNAYVSGTKVILELCKRDGPSDFWGGGDWSKSPFFSTRGKSLFSGAGGKKAIGNGWGCLSYLLRVKFSDLVPSMVSEILMDYQKPSWYVLGCFSLNQIPEISITRTILMIWLEPLKHIDQGVFIFEIFQFFVFELVLFWGRHQLLPLPHKLDLVTLSNFIGGRFRNSRRAPPPSYVKV